MMVEPKTEQQMFKSGSGGSESSSPEVFPKRTKMKSRCGSSTSGSPEGEKLPPQEKIIDTTTQNFAIIKNMPGFVDHTDFIRGFSGGFSGGKCWAIFGPRRFGKSSHLHMLKSFLTCVDESTCEPYANMDRPPEERENYELFKDTKIINCKYILKEHLGKHPVIHLDFKGAPPIHNVEDAKNHFRMAVSKAYREHRYLITSQKLCVYTSESNARCQQWCATWCDEEQYKNQGLAVALSSLVNHLYNHFDGAKVYVLVDEFDAINVSALRNVTGEVDHRNRQITKIGEVVESYLCQVTKGAVKVAGVLITGVFRIMGFGTGMNNIKTFQFLDGNSIFLNHTDFVPLYGATVVEVESLVEKLVQDDKLVNFKGKEKFLNDQHKLDVDKIMLDLESRYNGYLDEEGRRLFCLWSVLQYLESGEPKHFWPQTDGFNDQLCNVLRSERIAERVLKLMHGKTVTFDRLGGRLHLHNRLRLQELRKGADCIDDLNFLMEQGYVSYTERQNEFKVPNPEVRASLSQMVFDVLTKWDFDIMSCAQVINELSKHEDDKTLQKHMLAIHKKLNNNLKRLQSKIPDLVNNAMIECALYSIMDKSCSFEFADDSHLEVEGKALSSPRPDYLLLHKSSNFCILWELKFNKKEKKIMTSKYALQEARGKEPTTEKNFKDYMKTIERLQLDALVIGLSVDGNFNVSLSYALNNEPKIFCITEKEKELHPDYYSDCIMLSEEESDRNSDNDSNTQ